MAGMDDERESVSDLPRRRGGRVGWVARWLPVGIAVGVVLVFAAGPWLTPVARGVAAPVMPKCAIRAATGLYCPGCGGTRAVLALLDHDPGAAFRYNPLLVVGGGALIVLFAAGWWRRREFWQARGLWLLGAALAAMLVFGVLRNLPGWEWLAPP